MIITKFEMIGEPMFTHIKDSPLVSVVCDVLDPRTTVVFQRKFWNKTCWTPNTNYKVAKLQRSNKALHSITRW